MKFLKSIVSMLLALSLLSGFCYAQSFSLDVINTASSSEQIKEYLTENHSDFQSYSEDEKSYIADSLYGYIKSHKFSNSERFNSAISRIHNTYKAPVTYITSEFTLMSSTADEANLLNNVNNTSNVGEMMQIILNNGQMLDYYDKFTNLNSNMQASVCTQLIGKHFTDISDLNTAFANAMATIVPPSTPSYGGGGGSSMGGTPINGLYYYSGTVSENEISVTTTYQVANNSDYDIVYAIYDDSLKLCAIDYTTSAFYRDEYIDLAHTISGTFSPDTKKYTLKVFIFANLNNLCPSFIQHLEYGLDTPYEQLEKAEENSEPTVKILPSHLIAEIGRVAIICYTSDTNSSFIRYRTANDATFSINGEATNSSYEFSNAASTPAPYTLTITDYNNDGEYDNVDLVHDYIFMVSICESYEGKKVIIAETSNPFGIMTYNSLPSIDLTDGLYNYNLKTSNGSEIEFEDIKRNDLICYNIIKEGNLQNMNITVYQTEKVKAVINKKSSYTASDGNKVYTYELEGNAYTANRYINNHPSVGETVYAYICNNEILSFRADDSMEYGVLIASGMQTSTFTTKLESKIYTSSGKLNTYAISEKCSLYDELTSLRNVPVAYRLNSDNEITHIYHCDNSQNCINELYFGLYTLDLRELSVIYDKENKLFDGYFEISDESVMIAPGKNGYRIVSEDELWDENFYTGIFFCDIEKNIKAVFFTNLPLEPKWDESPLLVNEVAQVYKDGLIYDEIKGIKDENETTVYINYDETGYERSIQPGDIILYRTDSKNFINSLSLLGSLGNKRTFNLLKSSDNTLSENKYELIENDVYAINVTTPYYDKIIVNTGNKTQMRGFSTLGAAYDVTDNNLTLITDYASTFVSDYDEYRRNYTGLTEEHEINADTPVYKYLSSENKFTKADITELETDISTYDDQLEIFARYPEDIVFELNNDDCVYMYKFGGETKLILIIDKHSDSEKVLSDIGKYQFTIKAINENNIYFENGIKEYHLYNNSYRYTDAVSKLKLDGCDSYTIKDKNGNTLTLSQLEKGDFIDLNVTLKNGELIYTLIKN